MKSLKTTFVLTLFLAGSVCATAQVITLSGTVVDSKTQEPIPYANVYIARNNIGTTSNAEGSFTLKIPQGFVSENLIISFIGYQSVRIPIATLTDRDAIHVKLIESDLLLKEVVIKAESPARIVALAYENINKNYPQTNTLYTGFYRESNLHARGDSAKRFFYVIEAVTKINKPSYSKRFQDGDIKLLQVRKNQFVPEEKKFLKWIAGAFTPMRFDVVKKEFDFIDPDKADRYAYTLDDYTTFYDRNVYIIKFKPAKKSADYEGILYIDTETYAIVKADYQYSTDGLARENNTRSYADLLKRQFRVNYQPIDGKWYIQSVWQSADGYDKLADDNYQYMTEYAATQIEPNALEEFEYGDKIQWNEVFLTRSSVYDANFWKDYNIVAETQKLKDVLLDPAYQVQVKNALQTVSITKSNAGQEAAKVADSPTRKRGKFRLVTTFGMVPVRANAQTLSVQYTNVSGTYSVDKSINLSSARAAWNSGTLGLEYDITPHIYATSSVYGGMSKARYSGVDFGLGYRRTISAEKKRPVHLLFELNFSAARFYRRVADLRNKGSEQVDVENGDFDKRTVWLDVYNFQKVIKPKVALEVELIHKLTAVLEVSYLGIVSQKEGVVFSDEAKNGLLGSLRQERVRLDLTHPRVTVRNDGRPATSLPFNYFMMVSLGIKYAFGSGR